MVKTSRGGQRAGGTLSAAPKKDTQPAAADQAQAPDAANTTLSTNYNDFMALSDDEKADIVTSSVKAGVPAHLSQTDFQRFIYNSGLNDKPEIVDDKTLDSMSGKSIYRNVNSIYDRANDINYTAPQIAAQVQKGRVTRTSDNGGSAYGRGIYFATSYRESYWYGNQSGNINKTAVIRSKLNSNAKIITYRNASRGCSSEIASGSKLGRALRRCDSASAISIYAMCKGYNVIDNQVGYLNILNRGAMSTSSTVKARNDSMRW